jgi:hypothetical protein
LGDVIRTSEEGGRTNDDADPREAIIQLDEEAAEPEDPRLVGDAVVLKAAGDEDGVDRFEVGLGRVGPGRDNVVGLRLERQVRGDVGDDRLKQVVQDILVRAVLGLAVDMESAGRARTRGEARDAARQSIWTTL